MSLLLGCGDDGASDDSQGGAPKPGVVNGALTGCAIDVSAGDHVFSCNGLTFFTLVDPMCMQKSCGVIVDVHGATMSGLQMRDNTQLHLLAPEKGFIVLNPSATPNNTGGTWTEDKFPIVADFLRDLIASYSVDKDRVHFTGFSQGGWMTWWFLDRHPDILASAAPVAGALPMAPVPGAGWKPRVPILVMNGLTDTASRIDPARAQVQKIVDGLSLTGGEVIDSDNYYSRKHWTGADGMELDYIEHDYGGQAVLAGHCIPGGTDLSGAPNNFGLNATTCSTPAADEIKLHWGKTVLDWFITHPRK